MKKHNWLALLLIGLSVAALMGYKVWDRMVTDTAAPKITVEEGTLEVSIYGDGSALMQGISATDSRDGDVTASLIVEHVGLLNSDGEAVARYAAFDHSGNVAKFSRTIRYTDYQRPRFRLAAPLQFTAGSSFEVVDLMHATDILDGDISHRVRATALSEKALSDVGIYNVQFRVTNSLGDTRELILPVELLPTGTYNASLSLEEYLVYLSVGDQFDGKSYLDSFRYGTNQTDLSGGVPESIQLSMTGTVDTGRPGIYEVKYTVNYTLGSQTFTAGTRLVVVVEE